MIQPLQANIIEILLGVGVWLIIGAVIFAVIGGIIYFFINVVSRAWHSPKE